LQEIAIRFTISSHGRKDRRMKKIIIFIFTASCLFSVNFAHESMENIEETILPESNDFSVDRGGLSKSYGQLAVSSQNITFETANSWVVVPFNSSDSKSHMGVSTTPPAKFTIHQAGTYQLNASFYFSVENSHEGTFDITTYTLGMSVNNGVITPVASVYATDPTTFSLNYSSLMHLSKHDKIKFYMKASVLGFGFGFSNIVTLNNGNAHLVKIS
jgi:hypothetical protein